MMTRLPVFTVTPPLEHVAVNTDDLVLQAF